MRDESIDLDPGVKPQDDTSVLFILTLETMFVFKKIKNLSFHGLTVESSKLEVVSIANSYVILGLEPGAR